MYRPTAARTTGRVFLREFDLTTFDGLSSAVQEVGSWVELSRRTDIPASTLKSRGDRLGVSLTSVLEGEERVDDDSWGDDLDDEDENRPILSEDDFTAIRAWVESNVRYLLHEAPEEIAEAVEDPDDPCSPEVAEAILCARVEQRLVELIYQTHGVSRAMLWWYERQQVNN